MAIPLRSPAISLTLTMAMAFGPLQPTMAVLAAPQAAPPQKAPAPTKAAAPTTATGTAVPVELEWPRQYTTKSKAQLVVYTPQVASWQGQKAMVAYAAVSYQANAQAKPMMGTITLEANTSVSLDERLVKLTNLRITNANIPNLPKDSLREAVAEVQDAIPDDERVFALDRVLAAVDKSTILPKDTPDMKADPPTVFFSQTPAVLVAFDGEAVWSPIDKNDLKFAINTNWDVFQHEATKTYYLRNENAWYKTTDLLKGPWTPAGQLPPSFAALPSDNNFKEVKASLPGKAVAKNQEPKFFVTTDPAELILLRGAPSYLAVGNTGLLWVSNTEADVFRMGLKGPVYFLVAGRWFSAPDFTGPWTFATPSLPADFKRIPLEHERSRVLAAVPGTEQAAEAVLLAQVPQTAKVSKSKAQPDQANYDGAPKFEAIKPTSVQRAVNTDKDIFLVGGVYYYCYQGVWFTGKSANGPWSVAETIPQEIYKIPASSPAHHVTYVTVEEDDDDNDDWVTFAAVAGYTGVMIAWGCAVWGSGYYYPPYWGYGGFYPIYYPHFPTYGYGAWYNPWTGGYGRRAVAYGPYGGVGAGARYNPRTGTYARGAVAWGPGGASGYAQAYNPRTGAIGQTRQGSNPYGSWGSTQVQRGDDWVSTNRVTNNRTGTTTRVTRTDDGGAISRNTPGPGGGFVAAGDSGNVYAGHDGNVYKRGDDGSWQKYENGNWGNVERPDQGAAAQARDRAAQGGTATTRDRATTGTAGTTSRVDSSTYGQLERDRAARTSGTQRTRDYGSVKSAPTTRSYGSYRGAGASRGGGGRRR